MAYDVLKCSYILTVREESAIARQTESKTRLNPTAEGVMKEIERRKAADIGTRSLQKTE